MSAHSPARRRQGHVHALRAAFPVRMGGSTRPFGAMKELVGPSQAETTTSMQRRNLVQLIADTIKVRQADGQDLFQRWARRVISSYRNSKCSYSLVSPERSRISKMIGPTFSHSCR